MPKYMDDSLSLELLNSTSVAIQLVDCFFVYSVGMIEDVLVKTKDLLVLEDFYILDIEFDHLHKSTPILFNRPFFKTIKTKINCEHDSL